MTDIVMKGRKAAIYVRVSTEEQVKEGYSVPAQIEVLSHYCKLYNLEVYKIYKDLGISGKSADNRSGLQEMLTDAEKGFFDVALVWKTNRLARNLKDMLVLVDRLEKSRVAFISYSEHFDTFTPTGRMTMQLLGSIGEFERNTIVENVKLGLGQRLSMGKSIGRTAYGYKSMDKELKVVEDEAHVVKRIFETAYEMPDTGYRKIAFMLNMEGYRTRRGKLWAGDTIEDILKNPVYIGKLRYDVRHNKKGEKYYEVDGIHQPIIDKNIFYEVQERLQKTPGCVKNIKGNNDSFLVGLLRCPHCGGAMVRHVSRERGYYQCLDYHRYGKYGCKGFTIPADGIEAEVIENIRQDTCKITVSPDMVNLARSKKDSAVLRAGNMVSAIQSEINSLEEKKERYFSLFEDRSMDRELFIERINRIKAQIDSLMIRREEYSDYIRVSGSRLSDVQIVERFGNFIPVFWSMEVKDKKKWLRLLIKEILLTEEKKLERIVYRFPLEDLTDSQICIESSVDTGKNSSLQFVKGKINTGNKLV